MIVQNSEMIIKSQACSKKGFEMTMCIKEIITLENKLRRHAQSRQ